MNPYPYRSKITFKDDGSFKVMVLSDLHFGENPWDEWGPEQDRKSLILLRRVLKEEKPDYVVINGDLVTGENTFEHNSTTLIDQIVGPLNEAGMPFSSVHGNHDNQRNISHHDEIVRELQVAHNSFTRFAPKGVGGEGGEGNYWVPIFKHIDDAVPSLILWFFDSRGGFSPGPDSHPVEDWVHHTVADWIRDETKKMDKRWGPPKNRGSLAFVHIPPFLVRKLQANLNSTLSPGLNADHMGEGSSQAHGKDHAFWNALTTHISNLHALVSGHDHGNEWCAQEPKRKVIFCFAKHSGHGGYGSPSWGFGIRNILFEKFDTTGTIATWIRMEDGEKKALLYLPDHFNS
ncbi:Metallo-dependent phosphatase [Serendipita vermifera]|nr:Metallo-dependent phosphatase [Serendipita vermifera]